MNGFFHLKSRTARLFFTSAVALSPFVLMALFAVFQPSVRPHAIDQTTSFTAQEARSLVQQITLDGFSEELVADPRINGPIGIRVRFTVHAPKKLVMNRAVVFVWMGPEGNEHPSHYPLNLYASDWDKPKLEAPWHKPESGENVTLFTSDGKSVNWNNAPSYKAQDTYSEDMLLVFVRPENNGALCIHHEQQTNELRTGNYIHVKYALTVQSDQTELNGYSFAPKSLDLSDKVTDLFRNQSVLQHNPTLWEQLYNTVSAKHLMAIGWKSCQTEKSKWFDCYCHGNNE